MASLMASTWSLVAAVMATVVPVGGDGRASRGRAGRGGRRTGRRRSGRGPRRRRARSGRRRRSCSEAAASHASVKRWRRASSCTRPVAHSSANRPPRPDGLELAGVTDEREPPRRARSARSTSRCREAVPIMPASSTITVVPAGSRYRSSGRRSVRVHSWSSLATVSVGNAGLAFQDTGRLGGRGDAEHGPVPAGAGRRRRARSMVVLPAPAGSDHDHEPVGAGDRARRRRPATRPARPTIDGGRRGRVVGLGVHGPGQDRAPPRRGSRSLVNCGATGSSHTDRPSEARRRDLSLGRVEIDAVVDHPVAGPFQARRPPRPDIADTGGWRSQIARSTSARVHVEPDAESRSMTSLDGRRRSRD